MNEHLVVASNGQGKAKTYAGERKINRPTTLDEAVQEYGSVDNFLKLAFESRVINVQRELRGNGGGLKTKVEEMISVARLRAKEGDDTLLNNLIAARVVES